MGEGGRSGASGRCGLPQESSSDKQPGPWVPGECHAEELAFILELLNRKEIQQKQGGGQRGEEGPRVTRKPRQKERDWEAVTEWEMPGGLQH